MSAKVIAILLFIAIVVLLASIQYFKAT